MLTDRQRRYCAEIAQSLDAGNLTQWRQARLTPDEEAYIWHLRRRPVEHDRLLCDSGREFSPYSAIADVCRLHRLIKTATPTAPPQAETLSTPSDLDFWADDIEEDNREDDKDF